MKDVQNIDITKQDKLQCQSFLFTNFDITMHGANVKKAMAMGFEPN